MATETEVRAFAQECQDVGTLIYECGMNVELYRNAKYQDEYVKVAELTERLKVLIGPRSTTDKNIPWITDEGAMLKPKQDFQKLEGSTGESTT